MIKSKGIFKTALRAILMLFMTICSSLAPAPAQIKIYVNTDLEGISGVFNFGQTRQALYEGARRAVAAISSCKPYIIETPIKVKEQRLNLDPSVPKGTIITKEGTAEDALHIFTWANK